LLYQFNNTLNTIVDPGAGYVAINAVTSQAATEVSLSKIDSYSRRVIGESALDVGAIITLASADLTGSAVYSISSTPMQQTDWFRFGVTYLGGQNFNAVQDEYVRVSWRPPNLTG